MKRWSTVELPQGAPAQPDLRVSWESVSVEYDGHIYSFSRMFDGGGWKHTDFRAVIDAAIKSAEDEAK